MKLQVLIHGINVVEDILNNSGDDSHHIWVMEFPLKKKIMSIYRISGTIFVQWKKQYLTRDITSIV